MALKIVLLALLVCCAASNSEAQSQGDDTSLPLSYNVNELQGDGATCPNDQLRKETRDNITTNIRTQLQDTVVPLLALQSVPQCPCMSNGRRVAYLNMTDPSHQCPAGWETYTNPTRACGRGLIASSCRSVFYPTNGISYSRVCGRVIAYQYCHTIAFYNTNPSRTIDQVYLDGVSITHGSNSREHVWSFASASYESYTGPHDLTCPCTNTNNNNNANILIPPFVGDNYFCDTGTVTAPSSCSLATHFYADDPLWDGEGCGPTSTCCEFNNPPWFCKTLPQPTTDDIEVRICGSFGNRDVPVELIELFVA